MEFKGLMIPKETKKGEFLCMVSPHVRASQHGGGWGGTPPHEVEVPPHQGLSPPIQKNLSPPP